MKSIFEGIQFLFEQVLFIPYNFLRQLELTSWWGANIVTWIFVIIGSAAFLYWMKQQTLFTKSGSDLQDTTAHSFLK